MKIGVMYGNPETTTGGNALKFYASVRIDIRRTEAIKNGSEIIGNRTRAKIVKNKVAPPFKTAEFDILYGSGISKSSEIVELGVNLGILDKSGAWISYNGTRIGQGRDNARATIDNDPSLAAELEAKIKEKASTVDMLEIGEDEIEDNLDEEDVDSALDIRLIDLDGVDEE